MRFVPFPSRRASRRRRALGVGAWIVVAISSLGVCNAYWTKSGSGTGSAANASANGLVIGASFASGIYPGGTQTVHFTVDNSNAFSVSIATITLESVTVDGSHASCSVADFSMPSVTIGQTVPASATAYALNATGTLSFANTAANQDACQGATVTLHLASA